MSRNIPVKKLVLLGFPNVGKSVLFNRLSGTYTAVSNYPGTTVEIMRGQGRLAGREYEVIDTPGLYSMEAISEEERVARRLLLREPADLILHVADARNLDRMLSLTIQLREADLPVVLVVNMIDEAERAGLSIDLSALETMLGIPVVATSLVSGRGLSALRRVVEKCLWGWRKEIFRRRPEPDYPPWLEKAVFYLAASLSGDYPLNRRAVALLLLQGDGDLDRLVQSREGKNYRRVADLLKTVWQKTSPESVYYALAIYRQKKAQKIASCTLHYSPSSARSLTENLGELMLNPWFGFPVLAFVLYLGFFRFVGGFGAGFLVDVLERIFEGQLLPWIEEVVGFWPCPWLRGLLIGEYGLFTLGLRYALFIVLPIVAIFFFFFSVIEDSGYLPRLAYLINSLMAGIGLNGRAVIPFTLGLGCGTVAVMVTRTLETKRERLLVSFLLSLAVPCSAQMGLIAGMLAAFPELLLIWLLVVGSVFLAAARLADRLLPGERAEFYMEIPPLRLPRLDGIWRKTLARLRAYMREVLPLFLFISLLVWVSGSVGLISRLNEGLGPLMQMLGLPPEMGVVLVLGFLRRDYGAAGLYDLQGQGLLAGDSLVVGAAVLTLFLPCIAQFSVMVKELGAVYALLIGVAVSAVALGTGIILHLVFQVI